MYKYILLIFLSLSLSFANQCRNEKNEEVDWFIIYKIPKLKHADKNIKNGVGYVYLEENNTNWTFSNIAINESNSMLGITLNDFYTNRSELAYVLYNDQPPHAPSKDSKGHTKGVILANSTSGLWLIHSVPHFITLTDNYNYPETGIKNGQSILCISLDLHNLNEVGLQLQYNEPQIYSFNIPSYFKSRIEEISKLVQGITVSQPPWFRETDIFSRSSNVRFFSFAKSRKFGQDLYHDLVAPALHSDLLVESWRDGSGKMSSNCAGNFKVFNIATIELNLSDLSFEFDSTKDHSKWTVAENANWTCIGDINRMEHQKWRGGGTVCLENTKVVKNYKGLVKKFEECNNLS